MFPRFCTPIRSSVKPAVSYFDCIKFSGESDVDIRNQIFTYPVYTRRAYLNSLQKLVTLFVLKPERLILHFTGCL